MRLVVVSPHPDDDVIGCGATIASWDGEVYCIYMKTYPGRTEEAEAACELLGAKPMFAKDKAELKAILARIKPDLVLCPNPEEEHYWHKEVAAATCACWAGPMWYYEVWAPLAKPDKAVWFDEDVMMKKTAAICCHASQCAKKDWPNAMRGYNYWRAVLMPSFLSGHGKDAKQEAKYCEAFQAVR